MSGWPSEPHRNVPRRAGEDFELPSGTYFWAVIAVRNNRPLAETGLAAFVVQR
ncbi:MAG: hypothetical protein R2712_21575 [Vicinamibacterales bacterium]